MFYTSQVCVAPSFSSSRRFYTRTLLINSLPCVFFKTTTRQRARTKRCVRSVERLRRKLENELRSELATSSSGGGLNKRPRPLTLKLFTPQAPSSSSSSSAAKPATSTHDTGGAAAAAAAAAAVLPPGVCGPTYLPMLKPKVIVDRSSLRKGLGGLSFTHSLTHVPPRPPLYLFLSLS
jgi:hypothetical protein